MTLPYHYTSYIWPMLAPAALMATLGVYGCARAPRPAHPLTLTTPFSLWGIEQLPTTPKVMTIYEYCFPLVYRG